MKRTIYLFLLCMAGVLFSCSEDDFKQSHGHDHTAETGLYQKKTISYEKLKAKLKDKPVSLLSGISHKEGDDYIRSIDSTTIVEISEGDLTTYTLKVSTQDDDDYYLSNLIIKEEADSILEVIVHYQPTDAWIAAFENHELIEYDGEIRVFNMQGEDISEGGVSEKMYCSYSVITESYCTCEGHPEGAPNCTCTTFENGYSIVLNCGYSGGGSGTGGWSDDDGGSGGGGIPTEPIPGEGQTPCQSLALKNDAGFRNKILDLKNNINTESEKGWTNYEINNSGVGYQGMVPITRQDGSYGVRPLNQTSDVVGHMHNHTIRPDDMAIPSVDDISGYITLLDTRLSFNKSTTDTYSIVVGIHGDGREDPKQKRVYAMKLENLDNLLAWRLEYDTEDKRKKYFAKIKEDEIRIHEHPNEEEKNEKAFLELLGSCYGDLGLGIYKANDSFTSWSRMTLNYNNVVLTPCN